MQGFKTITINALVIAGFAYIGVAVPEAEATSLVAGALALTNIVLRCVTKTPVFQPQ